MKRICSMDGTGDTRIDFNEAEAEAKATVEAKALFERVLNNGGQAFKVNRPNGLPDEKVTSFDQLENETVLVPRIVGG